MALPTGGAHLVGKDGAAYRWHCCRWHHSAVWATTSASALRVGPLLWGAAGLWTALLWGQILQKRTNLVFYFSNLQRNINYVATCVKSYITIQFILLKRTGKNYFWNKLVKITPRTYLNFQSHFFADLKFKNANVLRIILPPLVRFQLKTAYTVYTVHSVQYTRLQIYCFFYCIFN